MAPAARDACTTKRHYTLDKTVVAVRDSAGAGSLNYLLGDQLGSTTVSVNAAGGTPVVQRYLPYGAPRSTTGGTAVTDKGWIGQTKDGSTGLQYLNARYYDPVIGRFTAVDPMADLSQPASIDAYGYGHGSPVTMKDPTGLNACTTIECLYAGGGFLGSPSPSSGGGGSNYQQSQSLSGGDRKAIVKNFAGVASGTDELAGLTHFLNWEVDSGRIAGSAWWRAANGRMMLDMRAATQAIRDVGIGRASSSSPTVQAWISCAQAASSGASNSTQVERFWSAHQMSLHKGIRDPDSMMVLGAETLDEQDFIETVVDNVDAAAAFGDDPGGIGGASMYAYLNGIPLIYSPSYPQSYPAGPGAGDASTIGFYATNTDEAVMLVGIFGVNTQLWTPG